MEHDYHIKHSGVGRRVILSNPVSLSELVQRIESSRIIISDVKSYAFIEHVQLEKSSKTYIIIKLMSMQMQVLIRSVYTYLLPF